MRSGYQIVTRLYIRCMELPDISTVQTLMSLTVAVWSDFYLNRCSETLRGSMLDGHQWTVLTMLTVLSNDKAMTSEHSIIQLYFNQFSVSSKNVTTSSSTVFTTTSSVSHLTSSKTVLIEPSSYSSAKTSGIVSVQSHPTPVMSYVSGQTSSVSILRGWNPTETRLWSATVYSLATRESETTASSSVVLLTSVNSPTLSGVGSSVSSRGVEARSSRKLFLRTNFLVGTAVGGLVLLSIIISMFVLYRRR